MSIFVAPYPVVPPPLPRKPHSGMGIASFVIALASGCGIVFMLMLCVAMAAAPTPQHNMTSMNYVLGTLLFGIGVLTLIGIVFGIGGVLQANRQRAFAVIGLILNIALPIGLLFLMLVASTSDPVRAARAREIAAAQPAVVDESSESQLPWPTVAGAAVTLTAFLTFRLCLRNSGTSTHH